MKALLLLLVTTLLFSNNLYFGEKRVDDSVSYTVQFFSTSSFESAQKLLKKVPLSMQKATSLHKIGKYFAGRYMQNTSYSEIKPYLQDMKNFGFKDAFIIETTAMKLKETAINRAVSEKKVVSNSITTQSSIEKNSHQKHFNASRIIIKANSAYKKGNEAEAMLYYEMLLASGYDNKKIKNNLCYLYGKRGAFFRAQKIIDGERYTAKLLYAYAYGAVENNQDDFYSNYASYILNDKSGKLSILAGYYFEKRGELDRATSMYTMAYKKNPSDVYVLFSYARSLDLQQRYVQSKQVYEKIIRSINENHALYTTVRKRILKFGE